jgi:hypothetical protein
MVKIQGIPTAEIQFIQWKAEISKDMNTLNKTTVSEKVFTQAGGVLATEAMYGCQLIVPANAFPEEERLIQAEMTGENDFAGINFLPSQQFTKNVTIALPLSAVTIDDADPEDIRAFWYDETAQLWVEIEDVQVDDAAQVVKAEIDHFTRFGWGF